jgi:hypothetical protein
MKGKKVLDMMEEELEWYICIYICRTFGQEVLEYKSM